ncbi:hypothetical protein DQ04_00081220 [Trypanosoma grayi]|uniref:hypothetical protein n=1 Tax=Trypanosoma grayi TaxID=71804 RepID=UPI0004F4A197|nr:hypothetical protein DQ04_00081220 [Trypanosoma grayi]KEG15423.1 hypothetical protein DQ04_00081220 [Trypanosoma grayi]
MGTPSRAILSLLSERAVSLGDASPCMGTARYLGSIGASLVALSRSTRDVQLARCANTAVQQLASLLPRLPVAVPFPDEVAVHVFRIVKGGSDVNLSPATIGSLLTELDERITGAQIAMWRPQTIVASLHAIAKAALTGPLDMVDALLFCEKQQLSQLDERKTAQLLWCIARLQMEREHAALWKATCRRLLRFSKNMSSTSRLLVVEALITVPECVCDAQQELLCAVQEARLAERDMDAFEGEEEVMMGSDYQALKVRLLSDAHLLPVESIVRMLTKALSASTAGSDEVDYLLRHLQRRSLKAEVCRELLEVLARLEPTELTQSLRRQVIDCIRPGSDGHVESSQVVVVVDPVHALGTVCTAAALERQHTRTVGAETRGLLEELLEKCHEMHDVVWNRYSGRLAGTLGVALDVLASCDPAKEDCASAANCRRMLERFPRAWEEGGVTSAVVTECAACVCSACELLRVPHLLRSTERTIGATDVVMEEEGETESSMYRGTDALLQRCTDTLERFAPFLSAAVAFEIWRAAAGVATGRSGALRPLMVLLLTFAEQHPAEFSLREVAMFVGAECHQFPAEAFELFVRCLMNESKNVTPAQLDVLAAAVEAVAARLDKALLEKLLLQLFLRPLGQEKALVRTIPIPTSVLVRLYRCCDVASDVAASMQATLLELIVDSCAQCTTMEELNTAASLLPQLQQGTLKDALAWALTKRGTLNAAVAPDVQKALLVVYLQKAGVAVDEGLLTALRRRP